MRPTVINCYDGDLGTVDAWWAQWKDFIFKKEVTVNGRNGVETKLVQKMLSPIKHSKYPAITEEEEAISIPLQTMAGAVFDAILVHMMNTLAPGTWQPLRKDLCDKLNRKKNARTVEILQTTYSDVDVQFLQEVAGAFIGTAKAQALGSKLFEVHAPADIDSDRDQNSLILLKNGLFTNVKEVTPEVIAGYQAPAGATSTSLPVSSGDLFVLTCDRATDGKRFLFASFHGDTNGLCTIPVVTAVHQYASLHQEYTLLFGMDANTYETPKVGSQHYPISLTMHEHMP